MLDGMSINIWKYLREVEVAWLTKLLLNRKESFKHTHTYTYILERGSPCFAQAQSSLFEIRKIYLWTFNFSNSMIFVFFLYNINDITLISK